MASLKWINSNLVMGLVVVCLMAVTTSSGFPQKKRDNTLPETSSKANSWIIQAPKRPLPGLGVGLPPGGMLLMTMEPNATMIEPDQPPQQQQQQQQQQLLESTTTSTSAPVTLTTSEPAVTEVSAISQKPNEPVHHTEEPVTSPGVDDIAVTETLSTSTLGTEAVTEASTPTTTTQESSVAVTQESSNPVSPVTEADVVTEASTTFPSISLDPNATPVTLGIEAVESDDDQTTTEAPELSTTTEAEGTTEESGNSTEDGSWHSDVTSEAATDDGSGDEEITTEVGVSLHSDDVSQEVSDSGSGAVGLESNSSSETNTSTESGSGAGSEESSDGGSGAAESEETSDAGSGSLLPLVANDESDVEAGSGTNPDDGSDAPPDVPAALLEGSASDDLVEVTTDSSSETESSAATEIAEAEAQFLVFTTEAAPEDPGIGESTTEAIELSRKNVEGSSSPAVVEKSEPEIPASPQVKNAGNSRNLFSVDIRADGAADGVKVTDEVVEVSQKSDEGDEEARQYHRRPYPIAERPIRRPASIDRHDQNLRPDYDTYDSNIIYRTYDYCFTLWCKFKTQLSRIGLL